MADRTDESLLAEAWDRLDSAIQRTGCALPLQLSAAIRDLEHERQNMRSVIYSILMRKVPPNPLPTPGGT